LFIGTQLRSPLDIASKKGLKIYQEEEGAYGPGLYFSDNSKDAVTQAHTTEDGLKQIMLCYVIVGDSYKIELDEHVPGKQPRRADG
jgi:hypothetical protein